MIRRIVLAYLAIVVFLFVSGEMQSADDAAADQFAHQYDAATPNQ